MTQLVITRDWHKTSLARAVPGAYFDQDERAWCVDPDKLDARGSAVLLKLFPDHRGTVTAPPPPETRPVDFATPLFGHWRPEEALPCHDLNVVDHLYPYQVVDLAYVSARLSQDGGAYIGWDRGLGKTLGAITLMTAWGKTARILVVCPNSAKETVWRPEIERWWPGTRVHNIGGSKAKRNAAVKQWEDRGGVALVHYEALRLVEWPQVDLLIVDEAHRLARGGPGSKNVPKFYKALKKIKANERLALSGSIVVNSEEDIFGAAHWLFPKRYKSRWKDWNDRFLEYVTGDYGTALVGVKGDKLDELRNEMGTWMVVRRKQDELPGLPERIEQTILVDLSSAQRKVYNDLARKFYAELPDGSILMTPTVLAQLAKLRQVATGLDLLGTEFTDSAKLDLVETLVTDNLPHKTVVFCWHRATVEATCSRLSAQGVNVRAVHGGIPQKQRDARVAEFTDPNAGVDCLVATIKTLGESVNLQCAADVVFVEQSWTSADMEQAADRVYRIGQERRVTITWVVARDTVDEWRVVPAIETKAAMRKALFG